MGELLLFSQEECGTRNVVDFRAFPGGNEFCAEGLKKSGITKRAVQRYKSVMGTLARAYARAGCACPLELAVIMGEINIKGAFSAIKGINNKKACRQLLNKYVVWLKKKMVIPSGYTLPRIEMPKEQCDLDTRNALKMFNIYRDVDKVPVQFVCLLAADLHLRTSEILKIRTTSFDITKRKLRIQQDREKDEKVCELTDAIVSFINKYPEVVKGDRFLLSREYPISYKTLGRRLRYAIKPQFRRNITIQTIASFHGPVPLPLSVVDHRNIQSSQQDMFSNF